MYDASQSVPKASGRHNHERCPGYFVAAVDDDQSYGARNAKSFNDVHARTNQFPATTFVITHSPSRSNRRDGFGFSEERSDGAGSDAHPPYVVKAAHRLAAEGLPRSAIAAHLRLTTSAVCGMLWRASEHASGEKPRLRPTHAVCVQARFAGRYKICSAP